MPTQRRMNMAVIGPLAVARISAMFITHPAMPKKMTAMTTSAGPAESFVRTSAPYMVEGRLGARLRSVGRGLALCAIRSAGVPVSKTLGFAFGDLEALTSSVLMTG